MADTTRADVVQAVRALCSSGLLNENHPMVKSFLDGKDDEVTISNIHTMDDCGLWKSYIICH